MSRADINVSFPDPRPLSVFRELIVSLVELKVMSPHVTLGANPHLGPNTSFCSLQDSYGFVDVGRPLLREDVSVVYKCCCFSTLQLFLGPSPTGTITIFFM
jgi:hypothetical protein